MECAAGRKASDGARGLRLLIETEPDFVVCGGASASRKRSKATGSQTSSCTAWSSPKRTGPRVVTMLRGRFPRARLVALSRLDAPVHVHLALGAGDNGYILKTASVAELIGALRQVAQGQAWVQPSLGA